MSAGKGIVLGAAVVLASAGITGCQSDAQLSNVPTDHTVTWLDNGMPYFEYEDPSLNHYRFIYHPNSQLYFEPYTARYFWYQDGTWFEGAAHEVPKQCTIDTRIAKVIECPTVYPFQSHDTVVAAHSPRRHMPDGFDARTTLGFGLQMANADGTFPEPVEVVEVFETFETLEMFEAFEVIAPDTAADAIIPIDDAVPFEVVTTEAAEGKALTASDAMIPIDYTVPFEVVTTETAEGEALTAADEMIPIEDAVEDNAVVLDDMWIVLPETQPAVTEDPVSAEQTLDGVPTADASEEDEEDTEVQVVEAESDRPEDE